MARAGETTINLQSAEEPTAWIPVGLFNRFTCEIIPASGYTNASWVVDLEWVLCVDAEADRHQDFSPAIQPDYSTPYIANASVTNRGYVRLHTSTPESTADAAAKVVWRLT